MVSLLQAILRVFGHQMSNSAARPGSCPDHEPWSALLASACMTVGSGNLNHVLCLALQINHSSKRSQNTTVCKFQEAQ